jgi:hypothetical protein
VLPDDSVIEWREGDPDPEELWEPVREGVPVCAHNARQFDKYVWERLRWPKPSDWVDTVVMARERKLRASLGALATLVGRGKDDEGRDLVVSLNKKYARSRAIPKRVPKVSDEDLTRIVDYCRSDTITLRDVWFHLLTVPVPDEDELLDEDGEEEDFGDLDELVESEPEHSAPVHDRLVQGDALPSVQATQWQQPAAYPAPAQPWPQSPAPPQQWQYPQQNAPSWNHYPQQRAARKGNRLGSIVIVVTVLVLPVVAIAVLAANHQPPQPTTQGSTAETPEPPTPEGTTDCGSTEHFPPKAHLRGLWKDYRCDESNAPGCLTRGEYTDTQGRGCPGSELCCPPGQ